MAVQLDTTFHFFFMKKSLTSILLDVQILLLLSVNKRRLSQPLKAPASTCVIVFVSVCTAFRCRRSRQSDKVRDEKMKWSPIFTRKGTTPFPRAGTPQATSFTPTHLDRAPAYSSGPGKHLLEFCGAHLCPSKAKTGYEALETCLVRYDQFDCTP